jgi:hypothetical protein
VFDRKLFVGSFISKVFPFVPDGSRWFEIVPDGSRWFQMVAGNVNALTADNLKQTGTIWNKLEQTGTT